MGRGSGAALAHGAARAALAALSLGALLALPWEPHVDTEFVRDTSYDAAGPNAPIDAAAFSRATERIPSRGELLEAWVYLPKGLSKPPPVIIMAHGLGAQKDVGLGAYGERFAKAGIAAVVFDYRTFGGSDGEPRHWVSVTRHLQDYASVLDHVQSTNLGGRVDGGRVALWGVSFSGGHVMETAARLGPQRIKAIVANEPYLRPPHPLDGHYPDARRTLRMLAAALSDALRRLLGLPPVYVRLAAPISEGALALVPLLDSDLPHFKPDGPARRYQGGWKNKVCARMLFGTLAYYPGRRAASISVPAFFRAGARDHLAPPDAVRAAAGKVAAETHVQVLNASHIEAHPMGLRPENLDPLLAFLHRHLAVDPAEAAAVAALASGERAAAAAAAAEVSVQFPETD
ncbi:alpha beta hydrolase [Raphidocelis subcapitata]|uniref:Alpha beta hydrolase n=1 Tax=Raphidocelis subcapitata TaxID=307507 RepID=A0A2V0NVJ6_9CHLO|nr:alpha beta hydrolase [Raphidocelis subcapitata]|eukprot:GBF91668.1 alpha beta hydrolase [Raphidocelis subcapitata]